VGYSILRARPANLYSGTSRSLRSTGLKRRRHKLKGATDLTKWSLVTAKRRGSKVSSDGCVQLLLHYERFSAIVYDTLCDALQSQIDARSRVCRNSLHKPEVQAQSTPNGHDLRPEQLCFIRQVTDGQGRQYPETGFQRHLYTTPKDLYLDHFSVYNQLFNLTH